MPGHTGQLWNREGESLYLTLVVDLSDVRRLEPAIAVGVSGADVEFFESILLPHSSVVPWDRIHGRLDLTRRGNPDRGTGGLDAALELAQLRPVIEGHHDRVGVQLAHDQRTVRPSNVNQTKIALVTKSDSRSLVEVVVLECNKEGKVDTRHGGCRGASLDGQPDQTRQHGVRRKSSLPPRQLLKAVSTHRGTTRKNKRT